METKDIQYFLEAEDKFKKSHPNYGDFFTMKSMALERLDKMIEQIFSWINLLPKIHLLSKNL